MTRSFSKEVNEFSSLIFSRIIEFVNKFKNFVTLNSYSTSFDDISIDAFAKLFNVIWIDDINLTKLFFFIKAYLMTISLFDSFSSIVRRQMSDMQL
jgi:hypothetical protein